MLSEQRRKFVIPSSANTLKCFANAFVDARLRNKLIPLPSIRNWITAWEPSMAALFLVYSKSVK